MKIIKAEMFRRAVDLIFVVIILGALFFGMITCEARLEWEQQCHWAGKSVQYDSTSNSLTCR